MKIDFKGFSPVTPQRVKSSPSTPLKPTPFSSERKKTISSLTASSHSPCNKIPTGDSPYFKMIEKDASKDVMMKQHNRADEFIEVIKLFRNLCSQQAQESLDNVLIDLYKLLQHKLQMVEDGLTYGGQRTKIARAQGKKYLCSIEHEKSRKALLIEPDKNKHCNLAICLMHKGRITEAKSLLLTVEQPSVAESELADSYVNSFGRATEMVSELESGPVLKPPDYNLNPVATCHQLPSVNDIEDNLHRKLEAVGINGEFRKPAARHCLYFDQKQEQEPSVQHYLYSNTHECAGNPSICSGDDGFGGNSREEDLNEEDFSGTEVHFPYDMDRFGEILRKEQDYAASVTAGADKKRGTVVIVYPHGKKAYIATDSRLTITDEKKEDNSDKEKEDNSFKEDEENENRLDKEIEKKRFKEDEGKQRTDTEKVETRLEEKDVADDDKKCKICYKQAYLDLRRNIEEVGEKVLTCERFGVALAGNYSLGHPICTSLIEKWREGEKVSDCSWLETLEKHCEKDKDTDFVLVTRSDVRGRDGLEIKHVAHEGTYPVDRQWLCIGSGGNLARKLLLENIFRPNNSSEIVEFLKDAVYKVAEKEETVGGIVVVAEMEIENTSKKLVTNFFRFPSIKTAWPLSIRSDGIRLPKSSIMAIAEKVKLIDLDIVKQIISRELDVKVVGQNLVRVRIYTDGIGPSFYKTTEYMESKDGDFSGYSLYLSYDQNLDEFVIGPQEDSCNEDLFEDFSDSSVDNKVSSVDEFERLCQLINGREYIFWDNESAVFVIC
ncbi:hypothetical protein MKW98_021761 [Papaver atlanticum]|uniref:Uncharacterized protein n=1 Tax=Papaver atlanticum TaxID=357466 RepID=A0AAD4SHH7_9MAGN|nr:hypothetical protein MKW98_021761 [Papaver atlanticum]